MLHSGETIHYVYLISLVLAQCLRHSWNIHGWQMNAIFFSILFVKTSCYPWSYCLNKLHQIITKTYRCDILSDLHIQSQPLLKPLICISSQFICSLFSPLSSAPLHYFGVDLPKTEGEIHLLSQTKTYLSVFFSCFPPICFNIHYYLNFHCMHTWTHTRTQSSSLTSSSFLIWHPS